MTSKAEMKRRCQEILKKHKDGESLDIWETQFIVTLLHSHPHYPEKVKNGIYDIIVRKNVKLDEGITSPHQFRIIDKNGNEIPFSFYKCIDNYNIKNEIKKAFRKAIQHDIYTFKIKNLNKKGVADHKIPFQKILNDFLKQEGIKLKDVNIDLSSLTSPTITDKKLKRRWISYHRKHAILRIIPKEENLKKIALDKQVIRGGNDD